MADPRRLYRDIVDLEKQLRELLRANPLNAADANALRERLVDSARALAQASPTFAAQREVEQVLWKPCFYKRIEDFRRRIRKYAAAPASDRSVREHFARVSLEFQAFLNDASAFYESLRAAFTKWLLQHRVSRIAGGAAAPGTAETQLNTDKCRASLHRCLVFLGDLARYRELHSQKAKKNFASAEIFYHKALAVIPENGNPHNQLAVLATYVEAETVAVYRYCRSLLLAQPFATAEENLALLFERSRQRPLAPPTTALVTANSNSKDKSAYLKSFLHRLTRMHGILFSLATRDASAPPPSSSSVVPVYSKEMESLLMKDLTTLLATGIVGDALLLKLVVTNIFCVVRAAGTSASDDALRLSLRVVAVVMDFLVSEFPGMDARKAENGATSTNGSQAASLPNALRLLGAVSTFFDFLRYNTTFLDEIDAMIGRSNDTDLCKRFAKELFESLVKLLNHSKIQAVIRAAGSDSDQALTELQLQLKENVELRGFKPLSALVDAGSANKWRDDLAASAANPNSSAPTAPVLSDQDAWKTRVWNVHRFARFLCEDYEGNPLLYQYKGQFSTSPSVVSGISNGFSISPPSNSSMGLFGVAPTAPSQSANGGSVQNSAADDFEDEIIVYQPSPALTPSQPRGQGSSALGGSANSLLGGPLSTSFGSDPFNLGANSSTFASGPQLQPSAPQPRLSLSSPSSVFGSFASAPGGTTDSGAIGSALGYSGFHSFGNLGGGGLSGQSAFSGQGFLSSGWGNTASQTANPSVTSLSGAFTSDSTQSSSRHSGLFGDMDDLAAIERESSLYQQKESSLSALFGAPSLTTSKTLPAAPPTSGIPPLPTTRSASAGASRAAPPPGFGTATPPGFGATTSPVRQNVDDAHARSQQQQFFTRNPFANP